MLHSPPHHHQYRVFHVKKLVKKLIIVLKWMKSRQFKPSGPEMPGGPKRMHPLRKRSATLDTTHRLPKVPLVAIKKAASVDHAKHHGHHGHAKPPARPADTLASAKLRENQLAGQGLFGCTTVLVGTVTTVNSDCVHKSTDVMSVLRLNGKSFLCGSCKYMSVLEF